MNTPPQYESCRTCKHFRPTPHGGHGGDCLKRGHGVYYLYRVCIDWEPLQSDERAFWRYHVADQSPL